MENQSPNTQRNHSLPICPSTESTSETGAGEMAKAVRTSARQRLEATLKCPHTQLVLPGGNFQLIIIVILSQLVQEQPAVRGACKAHPDENRISFPTPVQPNRSFNSTFSLPVVFVFQCLSSCLSLTSLSWQTLMCAAIPIHTPARAAKSQYSNCVSEYQACHWYLTAKTCSHLPKISLT